MRVFDRVLSVAVLAPYLLARERAAPILAHSSPVRGVVPYQKWDIVPVERVWLRRGRLAVIAHAGAGHRPAEPDVAAHDDDRIFDCVRPITAFKCHG